MYYKESTGHIVLFKNIRVGLGLAQIHFPNNPLPVHFRDVVKEKMGLQDLREVILTLGFDLVPVNDGNIFGHDTVVV